MSIRKMISLHPSTQGRVNQPLGDAVHHAMYCAKMCLSCADACAAETMDMAQCIRACSDCADVCEATGRTLSRLTALDGAEVSQLVAACAESCRRCAEECERHAAMGMEHCRVCAEACRRCEEACRALAGSLAA